MILARARHGVLALAATVALASCDVGRALVAPNADLADYRAYRVAAPAGTRLARAQAYLEAHPDGAWATEVRATFDAEEPEYFEAAKASRSRAREYLVDLPRGPHADAAVSLLLAFDAKVDDIETARLLRSARNTEALLERAGAQRRSVGEHILAFLAVVVSPANFGVPFNAVPDALRSALDGPARRTWGQTPEQRTEDLFFSLPTTRERESRVVVVSYEVMVSKAGIVDAARISAPSLFVRWLEADEMRARDEGDPKARAAGIAHAVDVLGGALEARMPKARCEVAPGGGAFFARACDGLVVTATAGEGTGASDALLIAPAPRASAP